MKKICKILSAALVFSIFMTSCGGESYNEVVIGKQVWMTNNLDLDKFRNGDSIPEAKAGWEWEQAGKNKQPAWCYNNNDATVGKKYGKLYNWYAVNDPRGLAPEGWHIPSDAEWTELTTFLGGEKVAGTKMKSNSGWVENGNGTNISNFLGLPGGDRNYSGFLEYGRAGLWWSSSENNLHSAWYFFLFWGDGEAKSIENSKGNGYSVRCIKDSEKSYPTNENNIENPTIGNSIKVGSLEIAQNDFPNKMNWIEAKSACEKLGDGWRLPTREELNLIYKKRGSITNLDTEGIYWSSTEVSSNNVEEVDFGAGGFVDYYVNDKLNNWNVRAVRVITMH